MTTDNVKSVTRVFQVLECFEEERRPLSATSIGRALNYPQSSTQALLKTMVNAGYLTYDSQIRGYFPTPKILMKTSWLADTSSSLLDGMEDLRELTGETVTLSSYRNLDMQIVRVAPGRHRIALAPHPGDRLPLFASAVGIAFLADQPDALVDRLIRRAQKLAARSSGPTVDPGQTKDAVASARERGVSVGYGMEMAGVGAVAAAIHCPVSYASYVLCVGGPDSRIAEHEHEIGEALAHVVEVRGDQPQGFIESAVRPGLERMTRRFEAFFDDELRDAGLTSREARIMGLLLARGALHAAQLAELTLISGASLEGTLASLTTKNLISQHQARYDLTTSGRRLASSLSTKLRAFRANALGTIDAAEAEDMQRTLDRLSDWIRTASASQ
jgi:DNA-binding IclR family transcriptional regulator